MGEPEQITKKSHRGESKSPEAKPSKKKVKFKRVDLLKILRKYAQICEHNITVKKIIKHKTYQEDYYKEVKEKLESSKSKIRDLSSIECFAVYCYSAIMYTGKSNYTYDFEKLPENQSSAFKDFYDKVIKKIPEGQQKGTDKDPLYRIFNRVTKLHRSEQFNDYDAYNEIIKDVENAEGKSPEELEAEREQRIKEESQKLKEMFDTISEKIEKMGEFNRKETNKIIKESMNEYKQYGSRGFTIACSYLNKFLDGNESYIKKIKKYRSKKDHTELEKNIQDYLSKFISLYNQKYHKEHLKNELKTLIERSFGNIKELSRANVSYYNASSADAEHATRKLMGTIEELEKETREVKGLTEEQKKSFNEELDYLHDFSRGVILNFVFVLQKYFDEGIDISPFVELKSGEFDFNSKFTGNKYHYYIPTPEIDPSRVSYLKEAFSPLFECLNVMYKEARDGKTFIEYDSDRTRKLKIGKWKLDDWLENGSSSGIIYPASYRPKWSKGTTPHEIKCYKIGGDYIYDIGETLGLDYSAEDEYDDKKGEHPFFLAVEDVFKVSKSLALYYRSFLSGTPFFKLRCKWHEKLSKKLQMKEINFNPIPTRGEYIRLFLREEFTSEYSLRTVRHVGSERCTN